MSTSVPANGGPIESLLVREDPSFADLVDLFLSSLPERIMTMEQALRTEDFDALRIAAHQLKGCGAGYGYPALTQQAADLERQALDQQLADCASALGALKDVCGRVVTRCM
ncbi:MAG: Hpt domain-containing protein [Phycisphaerae bacterium]|nr:Hpt domain-containing protein [Phycisphaerae bacterium]